MTPVTILIEVLNKRANQDLAATKLALRGVREETRILGDTQVTTTKRTFAMNQALFTMRRIAYGLTLGVIGLAAVAVKMGFDFDSAVNRAKVGFKGFITGTQAINKEVTKIYYLAAKTPFEFPDILLATQRLIPYNRNLQQVNDTVEAISNSLAAQGIANKSFFTRATIQFQHIFALGRVTGIQVNALARDGIALTRMLATYYHTTTANITDMIHKGLIPASAATKALIAYQNQPGFAGKNLAIATETLSGAWATVKDIVRFSVGSGEEGFFNRVRLGLQGVAKDMLPLAKAGKPISVTMLAEAFDKNLSPKTHIIINLFELFRGIMTGLILTFRIFFIIIGSVTGFFNRFTGSTRVSKDLMYALGLVVGVTTAAFIVYRTVLIGVAIATGIATVADWLYVSALWAVYSIELLTAASSVVLAAAIFGVAVAITLGIALLIVLYFRWQRFHNLVNRVANWINRHAYVLGLIPVFGPAIRLTLELTRHMESLHRSMQKVYNLAIKARNFFFGSGGHKKWYQKSGLDLIRGAMAGGGLVGVGGSYMVGEQGPEVVHLPRGAAVTPNSALAGGMAGAFSLTIEPAPIYLDGRKFSEVVFKHKLDRIARR